jgi:hypothetical protein
VSLIKSGSSAELEFKLESFIAYNTSTARFSRAMRSVM